MKTPNLHLPQRASALVLSLIFLGCLGLLVYVTGLVGRLTSLSLTLYSLLFAAIFIFSLLPPQPLRPLRPRIGSLFTIRGITADLRLAKHETAVLAIITIQLFLYLIGTFTPEVGFDALWYHLPLAQVYIHTGKIAYIPEISYSLQPRLGEMFLTLGLHVAGVTGAKLTSFLFGLLYLSASFLLFRQFLSRTFSLLATTILYSFPLVAWLSSSAYVDLPRAAFEVTSFLALVLYHKNRHPFLLFASSLLFGFCLSTKLIALPSLPIYLLLVLLLSRSFKALFLYLSLSLLPPLPYFLDNILNTGNPVYPLFSPQLPLNTIATGTPTPLLTTLLDRLLTLPTLPYHLTYQPTSLTSPFFLALAPILLLVTKTFWRKYHFICLFICFYLIVWWFLPYRDTRFLLPVLPPLLILTFTATSQLQNKFKFLPRFVLVLSLISISINLCFRIAASLKYFPYLLGRKSQTEYLNQFQDGHIDAKLNLFYSGFWKNYQYPPHLSPLPPPTPQK